MSLAVNTIARAQFRHALLMHALAWSPIVVLLPLHSVYAALYLLALAISLWHETRHGQQQLLQRLNTFYPTLQDSAHLLHKAPLTATETLQLQRLERAWQQLSITPFIRHYSKLNFTLLTASLSLVVLLLTWHSAQTIITTTNQEVATLNETGTVAVTLHVTPPLYTGLAPQSFHSEAITVAEGSVVRWCSTVLPLTIRSSEGPSWTLNETCAEQTIDHSISWRWQHQQQISAWHTITAEADRAPTINIVTPSETITTLANQTKHIELDIEISDDYGIQRSSIQMTLARGSGENVRFTNREWPIPKNEDNTNRTKRHWKKSLRLSELGMEPGDELYFFVRASDNAPLTQHTQTPSYTIRLPGPVAESVDSSALPSIAKPESLRSQRQIIIDTEQLISEWASLAKPQQQQRSQKIANDQATLRRRFGEFLGEESSLFGEEDDHSSEGGDVLQQYGHAHDSPENATLFDEKTKAILRRALMAMWDAEKELRMIQPQQALPAEYKALDAIKELQRAERIYLHRVAFAPPPLKEDYRLQAERDGIQSRLWLREPVTISEKLSPEQLLQAFNSQQLPVDWQASVQQWFTTKIADENMRLRALQTLREFDDGCSDCQPALRAYIRQTIGTAPLRWQARSDVNLEVTP